LSDPKFTVIIPTRERCDTLGPALRTCVQQRYDNLEIIVSDNASADRTEEIVRSFADPRIRYLNTGRRLAMTANWEFALSHVESGYVTIIGDDDGLMPDAINDLAALTSDLGRPALLGWRKAVYYWPSFFDEPVRNTLSVPLGTNLVRHDARTALRELMRFQRAYGELPGLYNAIADVELIRAVRDRSKRFFQSSSPDVYSAIVLTAAVDSFHFSSRPYGIGGQSAHSVGSSNFDADQNRKAFDRYMSEGNIPFHEQLLMAPSLPILVAESYLQARDHFSPALSEYDLERTLESALAEASVGSLARYQQTREAIRQIATRHGREPFAAEIERRHPHRIVDYRTEPGVNLARQSITVRADDFAAYDVYAASLLARHLLTTRELGYFSPTGIARTMLLAAARSALRRVRALVAH